MTSLVAPSIAKLSARDSLSQSDTSAMGARPNGCAHSREIGGKRVANGNVSERVKTQKEIDPATFLDSSFIEAANDFTTDDVKKNMNAWKEANQDKLIN